MKCCFYHHFALSQSNGRIILPAKRRKVSTHQSLREKSSYLEFFWSVFSRIQTEYGETNFVSLRIQSECRKMRTRKTPNTGTLSSRILLFLSRKIERSFVSSVETLFNWQHTHLLILNSFWFEIRIFSVREILENIPENKNVIICTSPLLFNAPEKFFYVLSTTSSWWHSQHNRILLCTTIN